MRYFISKISVSLHVFHVLFLGQVITPFRKLMLCAESRKEMEDWIGALKSVQKWETYEVSISHLCPEIFYILIYSFFFFFFILLAQNKQKIVKIDHPLIKATWVCNQF